MNFEEYKNTYFDGDEDKALQHLAHELYNSKYTYCINKKNGTNMVRGFTKEQEDKYVDFLVEETHKNPEHFLKGLKKASDIIQTGFSYEEIKDVKVNPYKSKILKTLLKALIGIVAVFVFMGIAATIDNDAMFEAGPYILSIFGSYIAVDLTSNISNFFRFRKAKKHFDSDCNADESCEKNTEEIDDN